MIGPPSTSDVIFSGARLLDRSGLYDLTVRGGVIAEISPTVATVDATAVRLDGAFVLPGLVDAHLHLRSLGTSARTLDLRGTKSAADVAALVAKAAANTPEGAWIRGRGWDQNDWAGIDPHFPTHADLDEAAGRHPVWLTRIDGHAAWLNQRAIDVAGLSARTPDPAGGEIIRNTFGAPTGVLVDNAVDEAARVLPQATDEELTLDLTHAMAMCNRVGLTGVHDMGTTPRELAVLRRLAALGRMPLRVISYLYGTEDELAPLLTSPPDTDGIVQVVGVKLYADGALGSRGAVLLEPYSDRPDSRGLWVNSEAELSRRAQKIAALGYQVAIHAIGDAGVRAALDVLAKLPRDRRHRVEHAQIVAREDWDRFGAQNVVASMQPTHATSDMPWVPARLGAARLERAYPWKSLLEHGALLAFGSDAPIESHNPWLGLYAAVTRQDAFGEPAGGWLPHERLDIEAGLSAFTSGPALAAERDRLGCIREGCAADFTVVAEDPRGLQPKDILGQEVLATVVEGRVVYTQTRAVRSP